MNAGAPLPTPSIGDELEVRGLRYFVAAAEELHFTRAAARLFVAQQALSREIRRLERRLGVPLFERTTRRVTLTPSGERLLPRARELVALHDAIRTDIGVAPARPTIVDLLSEGRLTAIRVLEAARASSPLEFRGRYGPGTGVALDRLAAGEVDVVFGRVDWLDGGLGQRSIECRLIRLESVAVLLPASHPLARLDAIPSALLRDQEIDANPADPNAPEWGDLVRQLFARTGAYATPPHVPAVGLEEQAHHLVRQNLPILTGLDHREIPGGVVRPIVDPVPLYPWSLAWRRGAADDGVRALLAAAAEIGSAKRWLEIPEGSWLPQPEATRHERGELTGGGEAER